MDDIKIQIEVNHSALSILTRAVDKYLELWPGGHPVEQESIRELKYALNAALLEMSFMEDD